jgi:soluble lytic murein transglycosylase-like protein
MIRLPLCSVLSLLSGLLALPAWGQTGSNSAAADPQVVISQQQAAAAAMQESLVRQQTSVQQQMGQAAPQGFFILPRAASLGAVAAAPAIPAPPPDCDPLPAPEVESLVNDTALRQGLDAGLLRSVIKQESDFRPCAVSSKGAMGLMQLMPATAVQLGIQDPFDAASNLDGGARFLKQLLGRYGGDIGKALGAYNAGPSRVDAVDGIPQIPETMDYIRQIVSTLPIR